MIRKTWKWERQSWFHCVNFYYNRIGSIYRTPLAGFRKTLCNNENAKNKYIFRFVDFTKVKGKNIPEKVYELVGRRENINKKTLDLIKSFENGMDLYFQQKWDEAIEKFFESDSLEHYFVSRNTTPSKIFIDRCEIFKQNPPGDNWDGVWKMMSK